MPVIFLLLVIRSVIVQVYHNSNEPSKLNDILLLIAASCQLAGDVYVMHRFLKSLRFFIKKKAEKQDGELTPYNKRVIGAILIFFLFHVLIALNSVIWFTISQLTYFQGEKTLLIVMRIFNVPANQTLIFLTFLGFLYLFHYQGMKMRREEVQTSIKDLMMNNSEDVPEDSEPLGEAETLRETTRMSSIKETMFIKYLEEATWVRRPTSGSPLF